MSEEQDGMRERQVEAVARAVAGLLPTFAPHGFTPEVVFEGAVKGAAVQMLIGRECSADDIADMLLDLARAFEQVAHTNPGVVQ